MGGGEPLVLVDGVEVDMNLINPSDIANISVLKDASSAAIYGVRAAYGVILITTKSGSDGKESFNATYGNNFSWSKPTYMPSFVNSPVEHANFVNSALNREGIAPLYDSKIVEKLEAYYNDPINNPQYEVLNGSLRFYGMTDWKDLLLRDSSPKQNHNVSVSGGSAKTKYYTSFGHVNQEGIFNVNPDVYKRNNFRLTLEHKAFDWLRFGMRTSYNASKMNEPHQLTGRPNVFHSIVYSQPITHHVSWSKDPRYPEYDMYDGMYFEDQNPYAVLSEGGRNITRTNQLSITPTLNITPLKGWNISADFSFVKHDAKSDLHRKEIDYIDHRNFTPTAGFTANPSYQVINSGKNYYAFNVFTDYEKTFDEKHYMKAMVGFNQESTTYSETSAKRTDLLSGSIPGLGLGSGPHEVGEVGWEFALRGAFGRINYIYDNKYLFEMNGRYDGTSRFPKDDRFTFLPSFSVGWRLSEEKFMEFSKGLFNDIKFRASYGKLGNQLMNNNAIWKGNRKYYPYLAFMEDALASRYPINGTLTEVMMNPPAGIIPSSLTWEKSATLNGGVDIAMLKNRFILAFDVFERTTSDMLIQQTYPELLGTASPQTNTGELKNRGWELSLKWNDRIGDSFRYNLSANVSDSKAKITKWDGPVNTVNDYYLGKNFGEIWGYQTAGIAQSKEEMDAHLAKANQSIIGSRWDAGDIMYADIDGNGIVDKGQNRPDDHGDLMIIGNTNARYNYSFSIGGEYKGIFLNTFFQGVGQKSFFPTAQPFWPVSTPYFNTQQWHYDQTWTPDNKDAYFAAARPNNSSNSQVQTRYLQDASYLRLKNINLGYNIPREHLKALKMSAAKIYVSGENLVTFRKTKGFLDPEQGGSSGNLIYPFQKFYSFGVEISF